MNAKARPLEDRRNDRTPLRARLMEYQTERIEGISKRDRRCYVKYFFDIGAPSTIILMIKEIIESIGYKYSVFKYKLSLWKRSRITLVLRSRPIL